ANKAQMILMFKELIRNAVRYRSSEMPHVRIDAHSKDGGWQFSVKDNGIGIDKVHSVEIFQLFHRLRGGIEATATGMGLPTVRKVVQQHHGHIWFESVPNEGTTFHIWLPESYNPGLASVLPLRVNTY